MWYKVDVSKNDRDEESQYFFKIKDIYKDKVMMNLVPNSISCSDLVLDI